MTNVINLDDQRPHNSSYVACCGCGKDWVAVVDARHEGMLECPECGHMAGVVVEPNDNVFFAKYMNAAKNKNDRKRRTMVLLNAKRMGL